MNAFRGSSIGTGTRQPSLALCLLLDTIGYFTYALPLLGEFGDLVWAPVSGLLFYKLFGGGFRGVLGGLFSFAEELLPFTDFVPSFTLGWILTRWTNRKNSPPVSITLPLHHK